MSTQDPFATANTATEASHAQGTTVDDVDYTNVFVETPNPEKDYSQEPVPVPAGEYNLQLFLKEGKDVYHATSQTEKRTHYIAAPLACRIIDEGGAFHGRVVFPQNWIDTTTIVNQGKGTSGLASIMHKIGQPVAPSEPFLQLEARIRTAMQAEPMIRGLVEWEASRPATAAELAKRPKQQYITLRSGMINFPIDKATGERQHFITEPDGQVYYARAQVVEFLARTA